MDYVTEQSKMPSEEHLAIINFGTRRIPSDGLGYHSYTEQYSQYITFNTKLEWEFEIRDRLLDGKTNFVPIKATPAKVRLETKVSIDLE